MPVLNWIGKDKVVNHHLEVPYQTLSRVYSFDEAGRHEADNGSGNKIIHGDNLAALKSLLPEYEGRVKCIYIDPPYNTGNENWVYNDAVNDPRIQAWLGKVVGKEGEDLSRHDKWLCMMVPRLKLLQRLLAEDGAIFISIDDIEYANLKLVCDEIFGKVNYQATFIWHSRQRADNRNKSMISTDHEYVLAYSKTAAFCMRGTKKDITKYKNPDNDPRGPWASIDLSGLANAKQRPNLHYDIVDPKTGIVYPPNPNRGWSKSKENVEKMIEEGRILFPKSPEGRPREKKFLKDLLSENTGFSSLLKPQDVGYTTDGTRLLRNIFSDNRFDFPKGVNLIETLIEQATDKDSIVLDSFAGSGTTAHAVLDLNRKDGGHRKFILIEMMDYAETITAERVRRVITGYKQDQEDLLYDRALTAKDLKEGPRILAEAEAVYTEAKSAYDKVTKPKVTEGRLQVRGTKKAASMEAGLGGDFSYYELGEPLLTEAGLLNEAAGEEAIRRYVYFMETREALPPRQAEEPYFLGEAFGTAYYFYYRPEAVTDLDRDFLSMVRRRAASYVIYADRCFLSEEELTRFHIRFKKIPRDIARL